MPVWGTQILIPSFRKLAPTWILAVEELVQGPEGFVTKCSVWPLVNSSFPLLPGGLKKSSCLREPSGSLILPLLKPKAMLASQKWAWGHWIPLLILFLAHWLNFLSLILSDYEVWLVPHKGKESEDGEGWQFTRVIGLENCPWQCSEELSFPILELF